jgi:hypothetical protein
VFIREASQVTQPFEHLAPHFVAPSWLHPLAITAVGDALQSVRDRSTEGSRIRITVWPEALGYELGPVRVRPDDLAVAMRWRSRLPPQLFPELFDGDLRVERADAARSDLTVVGTYPHSLLPSVEPDAIEQATVAWARGFLANVLRSLPDHPPPHQPR